METVTECKKVKDWQGKDGKLVPIYFVGLSDGQGGESFGKEIPVGTPVSELIIESSQYGLKIKPKNAPQSFSGGGGGGRGRSGNESFALSYAKDLVVAGKVDLGQILKTADKLYDWLEAKKPKPQPQTVQSPVILASQLPDKPAQQTQVQSTPSDDLPF